jgi:hypothetical protein
LVPPLFPDISASQENAHRGGNLILGKIATLCLLLVWMAAVSTAAPAVTAIQNNYSYLIPGQPNYGIAPGTLFM